MTDQDMFEAASREFMGDDWRGWLTRQPDEFLMRLFSGLTHAKGQSLVVRTATDSEAAATHEGRVAALAENRTEGGYGWDDYCEAAGLLGGVTEALGERFLARVARRGCALADALKALPAGGLRVLAEYPRVLSDSIGRWAKVAEHNERFARSV